MNGKEFTVSEVVDHLGVNGHTWLMFFLMIFAMIFDGYDFMVVNTTNLFVAHTFWPDNPNPGALMGSLTTWGLLGMVLGGAVGGILSDKIGRKKMLTIAVIFYGLFTLPQAFANDLVFFAAFRLIAGFGVGSCIPIVTIGASITAMYYVTLKMARNEDSYIFRSFVKSFKQNFKQSTIIWLILLAVGALLFVDFNIMEQAGSEGVFKAVYLGLYLLLLLFGMVFAYIFPLLSRFDNTVKNTFLNALKMAIAHFPYTVLILAITYVPMFLTLNYGVVLVYGAFVWIAAGFAVTSFLNAKIFTKIFARYIPETEEVNDLDWRLDEN